MHTFVYDIYLINLTGHFLIHNIHFVIINRYVLLLSLQYVNNIFLSL